MMALIRANIQGFDVEVILNRLQHKMPHEERRHPLKKK